MNLNKDPESWARINPEAIVAECSDVHKINVLKMAVADIKALSRELETLRTTISTLESNARVQAKLLAETGRERDVLKAQVEKLSAALKPFVQAFEKAEAEGFKYHNLVVGAAGDQLFYQDFERAARSLSTANTGGKE